MKNLAAIDNNLDITTKEYVDNAVPTKTSELTNDSGFITSASLPTKTSDLTNDGDGSSAFATMDDIGQLGGGTITAVKTTAGAHTTINVTSGNASFNVPTKTSHLTNDSGYITSETDPTVPSWAKASTKPTYTASEVGALPDTTTIPTKTSDLNNDSGFIMGLVAEEVLLANNITISGQTYGNGNASVAKTGYTPVGIVGMHLQNASTGGQNNTTCAMHSWYLSGSTAYWIVRGTTTATAKIKVTATVLYVKS